MIAFWACRQLRRDYQVEASRSKAPETARLRSSNVFAKVVVRDGRIVAWNTQEQRILASWTKRVLTVVCQLSGSRRLGSNVISAAKPDVQPY